MNESANSAAVCRPRGRGGFSLIEVLLAVGVLAGTVVTILALLPLLTRQAADAADERVACQLSDAVRIELRRQAASRGLPALAAAMPEAGATGKGGFSLVARRDGTRVRTAGVEAEEPAGEEPYFAIDLFRFTAPPLAYEPGRPVLPVYVRVSWPCRGSGASAPTPPDERRTLAFALAVEP